MVPGFSGGKLFAIECHRMPTLWELTIHSHHRSIAWQVEGLIKARQSQHRSWGQNQLQCLKCSLLFLPPHKFKLTRQQVANRCSNFCKFGYEPVVVICKTQKLLNNFDIDRSWPVVNSSNIVHIKMQFAWPNNMAKVLNVRFTKIALFQLACNLFSRSLANTLRRYTSWLSIVML